ncbi:uncharacterized protein MAM_05965 [Metarhizium album ARSEF 1941]|uniref:Uncharacterized protein n=1 Tax=Metarhizium album (strain ARSEF 1941) TaxID=1081103 RepID=A0A0B2WRJ3_METAS|nr:uncharacterized protein MAM_05965 [Metarhizium album ARSEF 1941]KHN96117.1 hypothetical protein MAM_05965 [Metarhizium album ARSEF 1941]
MTSARLPNISCTPGTFNPPRVSNASSPPSNGLPSWVKNSVVHVGALQGPKYPPVARRVPFQNNAVHVPVPFADILPILECKGCQVDVDVSLAVLERTRNDLYAVDVAEPPFDFVSTPEVEDGGDAELTAERGFRDKDKGARAADEPWRGIGAYVTDVQGAQKNDERLFGEDRLEGV